MLPCTYLTPAEREAERIQREKELASQAFSRGRALSVYGILATIALFWLVSAVASTRSSHGKRAAFSWRSVCLSSSSLCGYIKSRSKSRAAHRPRATTTIDSRPGLCWPKTPIRSKTHRSEWITLLGYWD